MATIEIISIAFPAISTGVYRFPLEHACRIAMETVQSFIATNPFPERVIFCCFSAAAREVYTCIHAELAPCRGDQPCQA